MRDFRFVVKKRFLLAPVVVLEVLNAQTLAMVPSPGRQSMTPKTYTDYVWEPATKIDALDLVSSERWPHTGVRFRTLTRFLRSPLLVVQVRNVFYLEPGRCMYYGHWEDASRDDLDALDSHYHYVKRQP